MASWLATMWRALVAFFAFNRGEAAGQLDQRQADVSAANTSGQEIIRAEQNAPSDVSAAIVELRNPRRPV